LSKVQLSLAISDYDHVRDFADGKIQAEGIEITHIDLPVEEIFSRFTRFREFDISEMSLARTTALISRGLPDITAIPVFPSRFFRLGAFYVAADSPIEEPQALAGKRIGIPAWIQTALVYARAYLVHQVGIPLTDVEWFQAAVNVAGLGEEVAPVLPVGVSYIPVANKSLTDLLIDGEVDAIISARPPRAFEQGDRRIRRLLADPQAAEEAYWSETGIFPIMHTVAMRPDVIENYPWVPRNLFAAFEEAKRRAMVRALDGNICRFPMAWSVDNAERARAMFGEDFWPYGIEANRRTLEAFLGFAFEQRVSERLLTPEEMFPHEVRSLIKI
jgi:4,5-dihydroxyphthalate decarboxylase